LTFAAYERIITTGFGRIINPSTGDNLGSLHNFDLDPESFGKTNGILNRSTNGVFPESFLFSTPDAPIKPGSGDGSSIIIGSCFVSTSWEVALSVLSPLELASDPSTLAGCFFRNWIYKHTFSSTSSKYFANIPHYSQQKRFSLSSNPASGDIHFSLRQPLIPPRKLVDSHH